MWNEPLCDPVRARRLWRAYLRRGAFTSRLLRVIPVVIIYFGFGFALMRTFGRPWVPGRDPEIDFTGGKRQDATAEHLGSLCTAGALQQEAEREEIARTEADLVRVTTHFFRLAAVLSV